MADMHDNYIGSLREIITNWLTSEVGKANKWGKYIKYTPDLFHLLIKLSADKTLSSNCKAKLATAVSYFVSPYDFIPEEFWGALGYVDDIALAAFVINCIMDEIDPEIVLNNWTVDTDLNILITDILNVAEDMVGKKWWDKLKDLVKT
ncbi:DUF1232 domain-containing protein [bacterium]|nr:DUF1232 domain-containing protein [bacterium]MBU1064818.1 DUF1232 domain-containing protein [bacterium]MBU1634667.1 DUF1232 domain-containing protein [bacterium]MBU1872360.1 DUF1232 domain-containing protein [bacterium]